MIKPLCVFSRRGCKEGPKVTPTMGWSDIPTCKEAGIPVDQFQMPRTTWLPAGRARRSGGVLRQSAEESQRDARVAGIYRPHFADRAFFAGEELKVLVARTMRRIRKCSSSEGWVVLLACE